MASIRLMMAPVVVITPPRQVVHRCLNCPRSPEPVVASPERTPMKSVAAAAPSPRVSACDSLRTVGSGHRGALIPSLLEQVAPCDVHQTLPANGPCVNRLRQARLALQNAPTLLNAANEPAP